MWEREPKETEILMRLLASLFCATAVFAGAAQADALRDTAKEYFAPLPSTIPALKDNRVTPEKIALGKALFFDPRISASGVFSCYSCHNLTTGGDDNMETSVGHGWQKGPRNSPTVLNAVLNEAQFWDGRAEDLKAQAKGPVQAGVEMANTPETVEATLRSMPAYQEWFKAAFPESDAPVNFDNMAMAIEAFEATLITPAPFDAWLNGDDEALTAEQKAGLQLFIDKGCSSCHSGVNVGGHGYYPFGLIEKPGAEILPPDDKGRFAVTETVDDEYVFRASPLRNIALTAPYFHSGKVWDLKVAVQIMAESQLGEALSDQEADQMVAFLDSLTGTLPDVVLPILPAETATTPRPTSEVR
ncbi:cytochrome c peroxidase [Gemmobacter megaterium]|uniref:Cytochrome c peroxidase n=2 Tax=Gemmobacter megaterium TaxID=1086013 RepID=A0A1N7KMX6_9RHOB|nr:cytochrome c biogenesis protein CcsA [Gemmobacter megaterium]SIS62945.1 cytochrome c peroxidase [Gemmobacter megaterium]